MFIALEGLDAAGKRTQATLLYDRLRSQNRPVELWDFPTYDTTFGSLVAAYLRGDYGPKEVLPPEVPSLLYELDRYQHMKRMKAQLAAGTVLVANRYISSNLGFQGAKFSGPDQRMFLAWLKAVESRLPQPDMTIFLDVPAEAAAGLAVKRPERAHMHGQKLDIHEADVDYQARVRQTYLEIARSEGWIVISCMKDGALRPPEDIHEEIWGHVSKRLR